jgi:hypothetical protein
MFEVLLGAALAIVSQLVYERFRDAHRARAVADAVEAELHGTTFGKTSFGGFSTHAFDELFSEIAALLPRKLAREIIGYHLRMIYLRDHLGEFEKYGGPPPPSWISEMESRRDDLAKRLAGFVEQSTSRLEWSRSEPKINEEIVVRRRIVGMTPDGPIQRGTIIRQPDGSYRREEGENPELP